MVQIAFAGIIPNSDRRTDTLPSTRIPNDSLNIGVALIEQGKIDATTVLTQDSVIAIMRKQIAAKDKQLNAYISREETYKALVAKFRQSEVLKDKAATLSLGKINGLQSQLKHARTNTILVGIAGLVVSGFVLYLTTK